MKNLFKNIKNTNNIKNNKKTIILITISRSTTTTYTTTITTNRSSSSIVLFEARKIKSNTGYLQTHKYNKQNILFEK